MPLTADQKDLYSNLLDALVTAPDLHSLLKIYKDDNKDIIRLSGTKKDLINNIFEAIDGSIIQLTDVQALIKDSEEFGDQHIFLYKLRDLSKTGYYNDAAGLFNRIVPRNLQSTFPRLMNMPEKLELTDFRYPNKGVNNSFLIKLYDSKKREIKENENFDYATLRRTVVYKTEQSRLIYLTDYDGNGELGIKISRSNFDSRKSLSSALGLVKQFIHADRAGIFVDRDFVKIDLTPVINNILENSHLHNNVFKLISAKFVDSQGGIATIQSQDDSGDHDLLAEESRKEAVEAYINGDAVGTGLVVRFLASGSNGNLDGDVNVIIGRDDSNHIIFPSKVKPQEYKYVRRKVAEFN